MLSHKVLTRQDVGSVAAYYGDGADDYYAKEGEASAWQGKGAQDLGLKGEVDDGRFRALLAGDVGEGQKILRMGNRADTKDRIGIDLTFSAPKSVSLQALVFGDLDLLKAHDRAVSKALKEAETRAQARQKIQGKTQIETTGNLVIGKFRHETSRERDPQLHTHAVILNMTKRGDGQWRALKNDEIIKATKYLGAIYRAELAHELEGLGYSLRHGRDGTFELSHISRQQISGFSQRSFQVEARLLEKGLTRESATAGEKQLATLQSRAKKETISRQDLHREWRTKAQELGIDFDRRGGEKGEKQPLSRSTLPEKQVAAEAAKRSVRYALHHLTERQSVVSERELIDTALKHAVGSARWKDIQGEISKQMDTGFLIRESPLYGLAGERGPNNGPRRTRVAWIADLVEKGMERPQARAHVDQAIERGTLVPSEVRYTTQTALDREKKILQIEREGRGVMAAVLSTEDVAKRLEESSLNPGQREAVGLMVSSKDRVVGVQGFAGTGKSHMLSQAKGLLEAQGYHVKALAPYGSQVKALRELGVESNTLASFLRGKEKNLTNRTVLVIDEAGVVPTRLMEQVLKVAEKEGARVVLLGDTAQTKAIEAGRPFEQLQAAGMKTAHMREIQRQKDGDLKCAVAFAAQGNVKGSLQRLWDITEIKDPKERRATLAEAYVGLKAEERDKTLIVSGTNEARRDLNQRVREGLGLSGKGITFDMLIRMDTTQAERRYSKNYPIGSLIQPEQEYPKSGLKRGELYRIEETGPSNRLTVRAERSGERLTFNPMTHTKISVYHGERMELSPGDTVRITRNDKDLDLANGDRFKVVSVKEQGVTLTDGKRTVALSATTPLHLDHAYATTVHSSQGLTSDRVFIDLQAESRTTSQDVYYVAISRARLSAKIFTNDRKKLPEAIARQNFKTAAHDLIHQSQAQNGTKRHEKEKGDEREKGR